MPTTTRAARPHNRDGIWYCAADPKRSRVYVLQGRDFVIDHKKGTMTFLGDPSHAQPLDRRPGEPAIPAKPKMKLPSKGRDDSTPQR
jgi:hypothetical protein